jgi:bleomycin hydrolase
MKNYIAGLCFIAIVGLSSAQNRTFTTEIDLEATEVISQGNTGTCWSFSTSSFLESEIKRKTGKSINISEMYNVRHTYPKKSWIYVMRQGKAQFSEGGLAHDVINSISEYGFVPNSVYTGFQNNETYHNHSNLVQTIKPILDQKIKEKINDWKIPIDSILDVKLGKDIATFMYDGKTYTPKEFMRSLKINPKDYLSLTSFTHQPYYSNFILNIPDNFSNGSFHNVPLNELVETVNYALKKGYSIALDCDVSEATFSSKHGIAVVLEDEKEKDVTKLLKEKNITANYRQQEFENYNTTDDHLMHIVGLVKDQNGTRYYKVKNSWGKNSNRIGNGGYIYMSEAFFKLKTISILLHKNALPKSIKRKI